MLYAFKISSSVIFSAIPPDSCIEFTALSQLAGLPIRIAVATVSGFSNTLFSTMGAAPAVKTSNLGSLFIYHFHNTL